MWATALFDEVTALGYAGGYSSFTRALRARGLRPACEPCRPAKDRPVAVIEHPAGVETQWDWLELPDPPGHWDGYDRKAFLLVGALSHSGLWRGQLCERADGAHLADALHTVAGQLGGLTKTWRFDRMSSVAHPGTGQVTASFAALAKHYAVSVALCPPRRGNRKGVVEKANHTAAQRWWRTLPDEVSAAEAQARLEVFCATKTDHRMRVVDTVGTRASVAELAATERLRPLPAVAFPATVTVGRTVRAQALVAFRGNRYSVPPELAGAKVQRDAPARGGDAGRGHRLRDGAGPAPPGPRRRRRDDPHRRARSRARARRARRVHHRQAAPPQAAHPTRPGRPGRRRGPARPGRPDRGRLGQGRPWRGRHDGGGPERLRRGRRAPPEPAVTGPQSRTVAAGGGAGDGGAGPRLPGPARRTWRR